MKRLLITGATGFIGKHCLDALRQSDFEIYALTSQTELPRSSRVTWYQANLHDHAAIKSLLATVRPTHLLHSAWQIELGNHWSSAENLRWAISSLNLAEEFIKNGGKKIICLGTCAEYDWSDSACSGALAEEIAHLNPHTLYGASKVGLFTMLQALCKVENIGFTWARPFGPYGYHDNPKRLIPNTVISLLRGETMLCNHPGFIRNFTFGEDVAQIVVELMHTETFGAINIANGQAVELKYVINLIAKLLGTENLVKYGTNPNSSNEPTVLIADVTKLKNELGYIARTSIEDGLEKTIAWWRKELGLTKESIISI